MIKTQTMTIYVEVPVYIEYSHIPADSENNSPEHILIEDAELPTKFGIPEFLPSHERLIEMAEMAWEHYKEKQEDDGEL